jgi:hypothetical protein
MRIAIRDDSDEVVGVLEDVDPDDVEELRGTLPQGWWF